MIYLIYITFGVFFLFWLGDLYLTVKTVKHLGRHTEINPIIRFLLRGRRKLIYIVKPVELGAFLYLLWFLAQFEGIVPFFILLVFIFFYALLVVNNAHVYYKATNKESVAFKVIFVGLTIALLLFIYLNYLLYQDIQIVYGAFSEANEKYILLEEESAPNVSISERKSLDFPILNLPIRRPTP